MKYLENFNVYTSKEKTAIEKYVVGNYVIFDYFLNDMFGNKPYRYVGKILGTVGYNKLQVEVEKRLLNVVPPNGKESQVKCNILSNIKLGDVIDVHIGNVISQRSTL